MTPEDIPTIVVVEELDLSVDGRTAVVVRRSIRATAISVTSTRSTLDPVVRSRGLVSSRPA